MRVNPTIENPSPLFLLSNKRVAVGQVFFQLIDDLVVLRGKCWEKVMTLQNNELLKISSFIYNNSICAIII